MNHQKVNYLIQSLQMTEEIETADGRKTEYTIKEENRLLLIQELVKELTDSPILTTQGE